MRYIKNFLTPAEHDALFAACASLPFEFVLAQGKRFIHSKHPEKHMRRHQAVGFDVNGDKHGYNNQPCLPLNTAPVPIQDLAAKLSHYAGKSINYLSAVRYLTGEDRFPFHQHSCDHPPGRDASVYIVSTGAERPFAMRRIFKNGNRGKTYSRIARQGSLIVLEAVENTTHEHAVPIVHKPIGVRYAINCQARKPLHAKAPNTTHQHTVPKHRPCKTGRDATNAQHGP